MFLKSYSFCHYVYLACFFSCFFAFFSFGVSVAFFFSSFLCLMISLVIKNSLVMGFLESTYPH